MADTQNTEQTGEAAQGASTPDVADGTTSTEATTTEPPAPSSETPAVEAENVDELPAWARKALTEARSESAARRIALNEANEKLSKAKSEEDVEAVRNEFSSRVAELERSLAVTRAAHEFGLPAELAELVKGTTEEEIRAHAETLKRFAGKPGRGVIVDELGGGLDGSPRGGQNIEAMGPRELAGKRKSAY